MKNITQEVLNFANNKSRRYYISFVIFLALNQIGYFLIIHYNHFKISDSIWQAFNIIGFKLLIFLFVQVALSFVIFLLFNYLKDNFIRELILKPSPLGGVFSTIFAIFVGVFIVSFFLLIPFPTVLLQANLNLTDKIFDFKYFKDWFDSLNSIKSKSIFISYYLMHLILITVAAILPSLIISKISTIYHINNKSKDKKLKEESPNYKKYNHIYWFTFLKARVVDSPYNTGITALLFFICSIIILLIEETNIQYSLVIFQLTTFSLLIADYIRSFTKLYNTYEEHSFYQLREKIIFKEKFDLVVIGYSNLGKQIVLNEIYKYSKISKDCIENFKLIIDNDYVLRLIPRRLLIIEHDINKFDELYKDKINTVVVGIFKGEELNFNQPNDAFNDNPKLGNISICGINSFAQNISVWKYLNFSNFPCIILTTKNIDVVVSIKRFFSYNTYHFKYNPLIINFSNSLNQKLIYNSLRGSDIYTIDDSDFESHELAINFIKQLKGNKKTENQEIVILDSFHLQQNIANKLFQFYFNELNQLNYKNYHHFNLKYDRKTRQITEYIHDLKEFKFKTTEEKNEIDKTERVSGKTEKSPKHTNLIGNKCNTLFQGLSQVSANCDKLYLISCVRPLITMIQDLADLYIDDEKGKITKKLVLILSGTSIYYDEINSLLSYIKDKPNKHIITKRYYLSSNLIVSLIDSWHKREGVNNHDFLKLKVCIENKPFALLQLITEIQCVDIGFADFKDGRYPSFYSSFSHPASHIINIADTFYFKGEFFLEEVSKRDFHNNLEIIDISVKKFEKNGDSKNDTLNKIGCLDINTNKSKDNQRFERTLWHKETKYPEDKKLERVHGNIKIISKGNDKPGSYLNLLKLIYCNQLQFNPKEGATDFLGHNIGYDFGTICNHRNHYLQEFFIEKVNSENLEIAKFDLNTIIGVEIEFYNYNSEVSWYLERLREILVGANFSPFHSGSNVNLFINSIELGKFENIKILFNSVHLTPVPEYSPG